MSSLPKVQFVRLLDGRGADLVHTVPVHVLQPERVVHFQQPQPWAGGLVQPQVEGALQPGQLLAQLRVVLVGIEQLQLEVQRLAGRVDARLHLAVVHRVEQAGEERHTHAIPPREIIHFQFPVREFVRVLSDNLG